MKTILFFLLIYFSNQMNSGNINFDFLIGKWSLETKKGLIVEEWEKVSDTLYKGKSFSVKDNIETLLENIELVKIEKDYYYIPSVVNQNEGKPIKFKLVSSENDKYIFENPEHDYPQRIIYYKSDGKTLNARIEGYNGDYSKGSDFNYKKME